MTNTWYVKLWLLISAWCTLSFAAIAHAQTFTVTSSASPSSLQLAPGQTIHITTKYVASANVNNVSISQEIFAPNGAMIAGSHKTVNLRAGLAESKMFSFTLPTNSTAGTYKVRTGIHTADRAWRRLHLDPANLSFYVGVPAPTPVASPTPTPTATPVPVATFTISPVSVTSFVNAGQVVSAKASIKSSAAASNLKVVINIIDANYKLIGQRIIEPTNFTASQTLAFQYDFVTPSTLAAGAYFVSVGVAAMDWSKVLAWADKSASFKVENFVPQPTPTPTPVAELIWSDEFNSLDLASASNPNGAWRPNDIWQNISSGGYLDFAGTSWNINPNHATFAPHTPFSVSNGILKIKAVRTPDALKAPIAGEMSQQGIPGAVPQWSGGMLVQNPAARKFKYGYFEIRARFPVQGKGMFPALWLFSTDLSNDPLNKGSAEIDLLEIFGRPNVWSSTLHLKNSSQSGPSIELGHLSEDTQGWHTYALDWQPGYLRIYRDGVLKYEVTGANAEWYNTTMGIRLNYAMDAGFFYSYNLNSDSSTPSELSMELDYVRVYRQKP